MKFLLTFLFPITSFAQTPREIINFGRDCQKHVQSLSHKVSCNEVSPEQRNYFKALHNRHHLPFCETLAISGFKAKQVAMIEYRAQKCLRSIK